MAAEAASRSGEPTRFLDQKGDAVPLSEDEQRILSEIEQQLYETDPALARDIADTTIYTHAYRNLKWALVGFVAGVVALWFSLGTSYVLAFGCFLIMLVCALAIERNARKMGKAGLQQITQSMKASGIRDAFGNANQRMRDRFRRDE
jgi:hypothetical protein